ncbi:PepSY domain-containing protein [Plebeiibacterium marinum]|uniref:PepSY domain-containing protein n=1 Tax=Plebeiibacterium marinum TaxID=2992111 RepID=A0AAE3MB66_9BACT|nr:PepSY domain-containing protein [Plebeiobacterium marinum]MCW3804226.1 PepSY domain-containing protein [Plebeiobacterium marinum]
MKTIRILHRYVGFFLVGIMSMYAISGIVLTYRNTDIFKVKKHIEATLDQNLSGDELARALRIRHFKIDKEDSTTIHFREGSYNKQTGIATYDQSGYPEFISKLVKLHMTASGGAMSWLTTIFGIALLFLAISSFWMFKPQTKIFKNGIIVAIAGIIFTIILALLS